MENRFALKDLILFSLLGLLIIIVVLAMRQFDRQYERVVAIEGRQNDLVVEVEGLRRRVEQGVAISGSGASSGTANPTTSPAKDAFSALRAAEAMPNFARGDQFIDDFGTKVGKLTPLVSSDVYQTWVELIVCESLANRDPNTLEFLPRLASRWEISDDGLTMTFHLRRGVRFSDNSPLTADDVLYTFELIQNPAIQADRRRAYLTKLTGVKKIDDYTVEFKFKEVYYLNFETIAETSIMSRKFYSKFTSEQFNERTGLLMGSGPYMLEDSENWTPGNGVRLVRNPRYWGTPATFDRLIFGETESEFTSLVKFGNREMDMLRCTAEIYDNAKANPKIMEFAEPREFSSAFGGYRYIGWNQLRKQDGVDKPTRFADKRVRQAMTMLLDRERMVNELFRGYANVASGPFAPGGPQSDPTVKPLPFDVAKAKALLKEAGFEDRNKDGIVEDAAGVPFKFRFTYSTGSAITEKMVLFIKDSLSAGGIALDTEPVDWPVLINKLNASDFDAVILGWSSSPESDLYQIFHSSQVSGQGDNRTAYISPELDKLIDKARVTMDRTERMKLWNAAHRVIAEDQPYTFLTNNKTLRFFDKRIKNVELSKLGLNYEHLNGGMIPWFVPKGEQRRTNN